MRGGSNVRPVRKDNEWGFSVACVRGRRGFGGTASGENDIRSFEEITLLHDAAGYPAASCVCVRRDGGGGEDDTCSRSSDLRSLHVRLCWVERSADEAEGCVPCAL